MKTLWRYLRLWYAFFRNCLIREMEFRTHFLLTFVMDLLWYGVQLGLFEVLYLHTTTIAGFSHTDILVFLGTLYVTDALDMILFSRNFWNIPEYVRSGELDFYLLRPAAPAFTLMFRYVNIPSIANLLFALGFFSFAVHLSNIPLGVANVGSFLLFLIAGLCVSYCLQLFFATLSIFLITAEGIQFVFYNLQQLGEKPDVIYHRFFRRILYTIFPVAVIASIPAQLLLNKIQFSDLWWTLPVVALLLFSTLWFFHFALRYYSSASS